MTDLNEKLFMKSTSGFKISECNWINITKLIIRELNCENSEVKKNTINDWIRISSEKVGQIIFIYEHSLQLVALLVDREKNSFLFSPKHTQHST